MHRSNHDHDNPLMSCGRRKRLLVVFLVSVLLVALVSFRTLSSSALVVASRQQRVRLPSLLPPLATLPRTFDARLANNNISDATTCSEFLNVQMQQRRRRQRGLDGRTRVTAVEYDSTQVAGYYRSGYLLTPSLKQQLIKYAAKVQTKRFGESKLLWEGYEKEAVEPAECLTRTPECALFQRDDLRIDDNDDDTAGKENTLAKMQNQSQAAADFTFLFRKCCIEHRALRRAFECLAHSSIGDLAWLTAGSLLGAVREKWGVIIPWDTDFDVLIEVGDGMSEQAARKLFADGRISVLDQGRMNVSTLIESLPFTCATRLIDNANHAHGHLLGYIYGRSSPRHVDDSRIEVWVRRDERKMQLARINVPSSIGAGECELYGARVRCPRDVQAVLEAGYGRGWCWPCKHRTSSCKNVPLSTGHFERNSL